MLSGWLQLLGVNVILGRIFLEAFLGVFVKETMALTIRILQTLH